MLPFNNWLQNNNKYYKYAGFRNISVGSIGLCQFVLHMKKGLCACNTTLHLYGGNRRYSPLVVSVIWARVLEEIEDPCLKLVSVTAACDEPISSERYMFNPDVVCLFYNFVFVGKVLLVSLWGKPSIKKKLQMEFYCGGFQLSLGSICSK